MRSVLGSCVLEGRSQGFLPALAFLSSSSSFDQHPPSAHASPWKMDLHKRGYYRSPSEVVETFSLPLCSCSEPVLVTSKLVSDQDRANRRNTSHVLDVDSDGCCIRAGRVSASVSACTSSTVAKRGSCTKMMGRQIASRQETRRMCSVMTVGHKENARAFVPLLSGGSVWWSNSEESE